MAFSGNAETIAWVFTELFFLLVVDCIIYKCYKMTSHFTVYSKILHMIFGGLIGIY